MKVIDDLGRELARRGQHKRRRAAGVGGDPVDDRNSEGERLTRARRRFREDVTTGQDIADHVALDRERLRDPLLGEGADDGARYAEISEGLI